MPDYIVEGIKGLRSGRPFAYTDGYPFTYIDLGLEVGIDEVNMPMALAEAIPMVSHSAIHRMIDLGLHAYTQDERNLFAALLFTNSKVLEQIRHRHSPDVYNSAGISDNDLLTPNGMLQTAVTCGLLWTIEHLPKGRKVKDREWLIKNLELMHDMARLMDDTLKLPTQFEVRNDILVISK